MHPLNVLAKFEIRSFSRSWDNREYPKNLSSPWICPRFFYSKIVHGLLFGWTLWMYWPNVKSVAFPVPEIIWGTPKIWGVSGYADASFSPKIFHGLLFGWTLWMYWLNLKSVAFPVPEIIGGTRKKWAVPAYPTLLFFQNFLWAFIRMDPLNVLATFEICSFHRSWDNRGYPKNLGSPWIRPLSPFSKIFHGLLFGWTLLLFWPNLTFVA